MKSITALHKPWITMTNEVWQDISGKNNSPTYTSHYYCSTPPLPLSLNVFCSFIKPPWGPKKQKPVNKTRSWPNWRSRTRTPRWLSMGSRDPREWRPALEPKVSVVWPTLVGSVGIGCQGHMVVMARLMLSKFTGWKKKQMVVSKAGISYSRMFVFDVNHVKFWEVCQVHVRYTSSCSSKTLCC